MLTLKVGFLRWSLHSAQRITISLSHAFGSKDLIAQHELFSFLMFLPLA